MTEDEKRGFEHGCRVMIKMIEEGGYLFQESGRRDIATTFFGFVSRAKRDVKNMTELYAIHGYDAIMQALEERKEEDER